MRVAILSRSLMRRPTGLGYFARHAIEGLQRVAPDLDLHVFSGEAVELPGCAVYQARGAGPLSSAWRSLRGVTSDVRAIRPDVFWSTTHLVPFDVSRIVPLVVTAHDVVWRDQPHTMNRSNRIAASLMARCLSNARAVVCVSRFTRDRVVAHWPELAPRLVVAPLAANPALQSLQARAPAVDARLLVNVDTLEPRKNLGLLFGAMRSLPNHHLVQCGSVGWKARGLLRQARASENVTLAGYLEEAEVKGYYQAAVAAVFPSMYEGFHLSPLDAMSLGCPVLASDIPVHREVLGDSALYFGTRDASTLHKLVLRLDDADERRRLAEAGRARAARFSWDETARRIAAALRSAAR